ncbi:unnamed protein product [Euphydryas editha]|uniref:Uncharacterized protein n=1 Tax=Euphydryas editha TaxID=104508 RepID=A0AAU9UWK8_EUPED|nr:unnamed protein product [Euphydryas editha]
MKFAALRIGLEPKYHVDDCYLNEVNPAKRQRQKCETHRISVDTQNICVISTYGIDIEPMLNTTFNDYGH